VDEYLTLVGTLLGAIIGFVGAYLVEEQHFKKERINEMRDKIYGPMFMEISKLLGAVKSYESSYYNSLENLKKLMDDYLFFTIDEKLKDRFFRLMERFDKYPTIRLAAENTLNDITRKEVEKTFGVSTTGSSSGTEYVYLRLLLGKTMERVLSLKTAIFLTLSPEDFIKKEKEEWGQEMQTDVSISGYGKTLKDFELLYTSILAKMEQEPLYLTEREQRKSCIEELESFLEQMEPFVKHKRSPFALTRLANVVHT
jgi:gas vesicle protein